MKLKYGQTLCQLRNPKKDTELKTLPFDSMSQFQDKSVTVVLFSLHRLNVLHLQN